MVGRVRHVVVVGAVVAALVGCSDDGATPIGEQSCRELVVTMREIRDRLSPEESFQTWERARRQQTELSARITALGGCPDQPALR
jgi:hypothetical protein